MPDEYETETENEFENANDTENDEIGSAQDDSPGDSVSELAAALAEIRAMREEVRELKANQPVAPLYVPPSDDYNPAQDGRSMVHLENRMIAQVRETYPDLPQEAMDRVVQGLNTFRTPEELRAAMDRNDHVTLADMAVGKLIREKKYIPGAVKVPSRNEPANTERPAQRREQGASMGEKMAREAAARLGYDAEKTAKFVAAVAA